MRRLVLDQRERVGEFVQALQPHVESWGAWYQAIGLENDDGDLISGVVYNLYSGADIAMHVAGVGPNWLSRSYLRAAFTYPFVQLGCRRVSGFVPASNAAARRFDEHVGFQREGLMRHALPDDDIIVYGMLREECRWIRST